ncbi:hypothetical protein GJ496_006534 [Pomphorhynchus laevis]|nr:hypothetical protein GJ496_006534 [Pomphorhynchus laevis]
MGMYYNTIISWAVRYFVASFNRELPWKTCEHKWNSPCCVALQNQSIPNNCSSTILSTEEYFRNVIQGISEAHGFSNLGNIRWQLILCLTFVFVLTYFALWKGVKSAGKFVWVTATAPYVMMIILLCKGLTLDGAYLGIKYYFQIDIRRLYSYKIWNDAATQMCFSLGPGFGTLLALSSYNNKNNNCYRDAIITSSINCATSVIAGLVVFCTLGHMAKISNTNVSNVIKDKVQLQFAGLESVITGLCDQFPIYLVARRKWLVGVVIAICFIGGLPTCTNASNGGPYVIDLMNEIAISPGILFVLVTECLAISWNYGTRRLGKIMLEMTGTYPNVVLRILWTVVAPSVLILITACQIKSLKNNEVSIRGVKINELPPLAKSATLFMIIIPASMIPIWAIIALFRANGKSIEEATVAKAIKKINSLPEVNITIFGILYLQRLLHYSIFNLIDRDHSERRS